MIMLKKGIYTTECKKYQKLLVVKNILNTCSYFKGGECD